MRDVRLTAERPDEEVDALAGRFMTVEEHADVVLREECRVLKPNGEPLLFLRKSVLSEKSCHAAFESLYDAAAESSNRGTAAGADADGQIRQLRTRKDGTPTQTNVAMNVVNSGVVGYYDRYPRIPYCRQTAFALQNPKKFQAAMPFIREVDAAFLSTVPERHAAQMDVVKRTHPDWIIHGTAFTTITVNRNFRTALHKDVGDLKAGFGVLTALRRGRFTGGILIFPKYRVGVEFDTGDVLLADVHEWHGNSPIVGVKNRFDRLSCVFYYREKMQNCGSAEEELDRAKKVFHDRSTGRNEDGE